MEACKKTIADTSQLHTGCSSPLLVRTGPSPILLMAVSVAHTLAGAAIVLTAIPIGLQLVCIAGIFSLAFRYYYQWQKAPHYRLQKNSDGQWVFYSEQNKDHFLIIESCYYRTRYLLVFHVRDHHSQRSYYPVLIDSCTQTSHRHLRVMSKFFL